MSILVYFTFCRPVDVFTMHFSYTLYFSITLSVSLALRLIYFSVTIVLSLCFSLYLIISLNIFPLSLSLSLFPPLYLLYHPAKTNNLICSVYTVIKPLCTQKPHAEYLGKIQTFRDYRGLIYMELPFSNKADCIFQPSILEDLTPARQIRSYQ